MRFEERCAELERLIATPGSDSVGDTSVLEDADEYRAASTFTVSPAARWSRIVAEVLGHDDMKVEHDRVLKVVEDANPERLRGLLPSISGGSNLGRPQPARPHGPLQQGRLQARSARFITAAERIDTLSAAAKQGRLRDATAEFVVPDVLVIDEVGCLHHADEAADVLFGVVGQRYLRRRPILLTTNKELSAWGEVLHDADLDEVILDRILERGAQFSLGGPSWRRKHIPGIMEAEAEPPRRSSG